MAYIASNGCLICETTNIDEMITCFIVVDKKNKLRIFGNHFHQPWTHTNWSWCKSSILFVLHCTIIHQCIHLGCVFPLNCELHLGCVFKVILVGSNHVTRFCLFLFAVLYHSAWWPWLPWWKAHSKYSMHLCFTFFTVYVCILMLSKDTKIFTFLWI